MHSKFTDLIAAHWLSIYLVEHSTGLIEVNCDIYKFLVKYVANLIDFELFYRVPTDKQERRRYLL